MRGDDPVRKVLILGGGNGMPAVLRGLCNHPSAGRMSLTAVVTSADDGGSSGRIRKERGGVPPGDVRNCLLALADVDGGAFKRLFSHRYQGAGELAGHAVGDLILCALREITGSPIDAIQQAGIMLGVQDKVLPVTLDPVHLHGRTSGGDLLEGESTIGASPSAMSKVWLEPSGIPPCLGVLEGIREADMVVLAPGSLFTSLLPVLLVPGVSDAVRSTHGRRVLVANLMTQPGETRGMDLDDHLDALESHVGNGLIDCVLVNSAAVDPSRLRAYEEMQAGLIVPSFRRRGERLLERDLLSPSGKVRHDPDKLAEALLEFMEDGGTGRLGPDQAALG